MPLAFPGESSAYREARQRLLDAEIALRAQSEQVAALRRQLPDGGNVPTDYAFTGLGGETVRLSQLFTRDSGTLALYSLMFRPDAEAPCPMCTSLLDSLASQARSIGQRIDLAVVAAARPEQLTQLAADRGWGDLRLLSAQGTSYQADYHAEFGDGSQLPMLNVFRKTPAGIVHFWGSEMFHAGLEGQPRHLDQIWPLWNMFDLTPEGRGTDWYPQLRYD